MAIKLITTMLKQKAVYWAPSVPDDFGQHTYPTPVEIPVRWEERSELVLNKTGQQVLSSSRVYVGVDTDEDGVLWLGTLASLDSNHRAKPFTNVKASAILAFGKTPTLRGDQFLRIAYLGGGKK